MPLSTVVLHEIGGFGKSAVVALAKAQYVVHKTPVVAVVAEVVRRRPGVRMCCGDPGLGLH